MWGLPDPVTREGTLVLLQRANGSRCEGCSTDPADYLPPP